MNDWIRSEPRRVPDEWIDYNGHMNLAYYVLAFDHALDVVLDEELGAGISLAKSKQQGPFALQLHMHYLDELLSGDLFRCGFLLLDADAKRLHVAGVMTRERDDAVVCVKEEVLINVDHETRRSAPYPPDVDARIRAMVAAHRDVPRPAQIGQAIGLKRRK